MDSIDLGLVFRKILKKWYWFFIALTLALFAGFSFYYISQKKFLVEAAIQLSEQNKQERGVSMERILIGNELLQSNSEIEDEIGILMSFSLIRECLDDLGFEVSYHKSLFESWPLKGLLLREEYPSSFQVDFNNEGWQLLNTPIHISFKEKGKVGIRVESESSDNEIHQYSTSSSLKFGQKILLDTVIEVSGHLKTDFLDFSLAFVDPLVWEGKNDYQIFFRSRKSLAEDFLKRLDGDRLSERSNILRLSLKGPVPQKDIVFLDHLIETYIISDVKKKSNLGEKALSFLNTQLQGVTDSLRFVEEVLKAFRAENQIIDISVTSQNLNEQRFILEERQGDLMVQQQYLQYILNYLRANDEQMLISPTAVGIPDESLQSLLNNLSDLVNERISKVQSSNVNAPVVRVLDQKIESTKKTILDKVLNLIESNNIAINENQRRINNLKTELGRLPENEMDLKGIQRRFEFNDQMYNYLLQKKTEIEIAVASTVTSKTVVDQPRIIGDSHVSPNIIIVVLFSLFTGLFTPFGLLYYRGYFDQNITEIYDLSALTTIPVVNTVQKVDKSEKENISDTGGYLSFAFKFVRLYLEKRKTPVSVIGITSADSGEGKSFCALQLAKSYASSGFRTVILEIDHYNPSLGELLEIDEKVGFTDYLIKKEGIPVVSETKLENLYFMVAGKKVREHDKLFVGDGLENLMNKLRYRFDMIIIDSPPIGLVPDYLSVVEKTDYTLWVVMQDYTSKKSISEVSSLFKRHQIEAGILYNGERKSKSNGAYTYYR